MEFTFILHDLHFFCTWDTTWPTTISCVQNLLRKPKQIQIDDFELILRTIAYLLWFCVWLFSFMWTVSTIANAKTWHAAFPLRPILTFVRYLTKEKLLNYIRLLYKIFKINAQKSPQTFHSAPVLFPLFE